MTYSAQLQAKIGIFDECFSRIGKLQNVPAPDIIESPEWNYRCRAQFKLDPHSAKAGFFRRGTNEVIPIDSCPLLHPSLNELLAAPEHLFRQLPEGTKQLKVIAGDRGLSSHPVLPGRTGAYADIQVDTVTFRISGGGFFQGNRYLHKSLGRWAEPHVGGEFFIDLYGGAGFFSVLLGNRFSKGVLIESSGTLVENATENLRANELDHIQAMRAPAERFASHLDLPSRIAPDLVIVDPPRPGLTKKAMENLVSLHPGAILYVSCDPATQARDIGKLVHRQGYRMDKRALFDLYPQTHHLETAVLLRA
jgi:tRNA/tmRNA/rRNA uracil-C5-methylase (TrmA/RlmC/RlmD family)